MTYDYKKLGFKAGLEIHQQLETHKLYCKCPSIVHDENPDILVKRKLRAVAGETSETDIAAAYEAAKDRYFLYEACDSSCCLVELDEEPPHPVNEEALSVALLVCKALNMKVVDEIQVMRKTVVDGSNVSGFQRTAMVGMNGWIETSKGKVGVDSLCLEEESAKKVETGKGYVKYRLDRLGIPLLEIATDASIQDPEHAKEVAEKLGMILRSTGKVKRGLGTIRQDVNVSIKGGARTEVKGFQDLKSIPKVVDNEIKRQLGLIGEGEEIEKTVRKAESDFSTTFLRPLPGAARMYPETDVPTIRVSKEMLAEVGEITLISDVVGGVVEKYGVDKELVGKLVRGGRLGVFEKVMGAFSGLKGSSVADLLLSLEKQVKKEKKVDVELGEKEFMILFEALAGGKIAKESVVEIVGKSVGKDLGNVMKDYELMSDKELEEEVKKIVAENKGVPFNALIGKAMGTLRGKAEGKKIVEMLKKVSG